ncbi:unnamed protein product [Haemonchus placei]|uniref:Uncharacterized protein n=1 Tax=Haemonchus placei TaxID=6290 RepID=A0A158QMC5_HAEPC|nr:unnamed protein product [Haemonchus placei]
MLVLGRVRRTMNAHLLHANRTQYPDPFCSCPCELWNGKLLRWYGKDPPETALRLWLIASCPLREFFAFDSQEWEHHRMS